MHSAQRSEIEISRLPVNSEETVFDGWKISYRKSHILASVCTTQEKCESDPSKACQLCQYNNVLKFPHLPDMVFPNNVLTLQYSQGGKIEYNPLDSLKCVDTGRPPVQVACAEEWQESRSVSENAKKLFDWTFTTDYKGTFHDFEVQPTTEKIDIELLKKREPFVFYYDLTLFEDELHDHGIASSSVKIRVMNSYWFILHRYFLRVDDVMARINDTRLLYQAHSKQVLMEYTSREASLTDLKVPPCVLIEPADLAQHLPLKTQILSKIVLPDTTSSDKV